MNKKSLGIITKNVSRTLVPLEEITVLRQIHEILDSGKNVEIRKDPKGQIKIYKVSKEIAFQ